MKRILILTLLGILIVSSYSCKSCNDEKNQLTRSCANGFVPNSSNTACECPPETHMKVNRVSPNSGTDDTNAYCKEKGEYVYYAKLSERNCMPFFLPEAYLNKKPIGILDFYPFSDRLYPILQFADGPTDGIFGEPDLVKHPDGSIEISFMTSFLSCAQCLDWSTKTQNPIAFGYGHGISNTENTKMDIEIIYKDGVGTVLDTGYIYLWKE